MGPRERSSISCPISYPCRARSSSRARIINSALPFFNSRSGTGDAIYCNTIYLLTICPSNRMSPPFVMAGAWHKRLYNARPILTSLVSDFGAGWAGKMDHFEMLEADFAAPFLEIGGRIVERVAEFDQHV